MDEIEALKAEPVNPSYGARGCKPVAPDGSGREPVSAAGRLASIASKILMQVLYAARFARSDLIRCINGLACNVTRWTAQQDAELNDLMSYVDSTPPPGRQLGGWETPSRTSRRTSLRMQTSQGAP